MNEKQLVVNRAKCKKCDTIIISKSGYDFRSCNCKAIYVDGGSSYIRRVGEIDQIEEMSLYTTDDFAEIRQNVFRGSYGKDGKSPFSWVRLSEMDDEYLTSLIKYKEDHNQITDVHYWAYCKEREYRK